MPATSSAPRLLTSGDTLDALRALRERQPRVVAHFSVEPEAHEQPVLFGLKVNIARAFTRRRAQDRVKGARRVAAGFGHGGRRWISAA